MQRKRESGMSLVEVMIGVALMAVTALALLPLFTHGVGQNRDGARLSELANGARSALEEYARLDLDAAPLQVPTGATASVRDEWWDPAQRRWRQLPMGDDGSVSPPLAARWRRTIVVEQFAVSDLLADGALDTPLDGGAPAEQVQLKRVRVSVRPLWSAAWGSLLGAPTGVTLQLVRAI